MKIIRSNTGNSIYAAMIGANVDAMLDYELLPAFVQNSRRVALSLLQLKKRASTPQ